MESGDNSTVNNIENINVNNDNTVMEKPEKKRKCQIPEGSLLCAGYHSENSSSSNEQLMSKILVELNAMKTENKKLMTKVDWLQAQNDELHVNNREMQTQLGTLERKLNVAELKASLAEQDTHNLIAQKVADATDQLRKEFRNNVGKLQENFTLSLLSVRGEMLEENGKLKKQFCDGAEEADVADGNEKSKFVWSTNRWIVVSDFVQINADGLIATNTNKEVGINVCAQQSISREMLASMSGQQKLVYYEMSLINSRPSFIGWVGQEFPLNGDEFWLRKHPYSIGIDWCGNFWEPGCKKITGYANGLRNGDVIGSGVLLTRDGQLKLFFTENGRMNDKLIPLDEDNKQNLLYPTISFHHKDASIEANFGADLGKKPFKFDIDGHEGQLFV